MKKRVLFALVAIGIVMHACTGGSSGSDNQTSDSVITKTADDMKQLISIVEIPTTNIARATAFYDAILEITIDTTAMGDVKMGLFPASSSGTFVQLIQGLEYKPSADGAIVYLNGGNDLQKIATRIEANGGKILVPKTEIAPDMGYFAIFLDSEGNKLGLHSMH